MSIDHSNYSDPSSLGVREARRRVKDSFSRVVHDVHRVPAVAQAGLRQDWQRTAKQISASALIRRYPAAAVAAALAGGLLVGKRLLTQDEPPSARSKLYAAVRPASPSQSRIADHLRRFVNDNVLNPDTKAQVRGLALSMAAQLAAAAVSRIVAEHSRREPNTRE